MGIQDVLRDHPAIGGLVGGVAIGGGITGIVNIIRGRRKKKATRKATTTKRRKKTTTKRRRKTVSSRSKSFQKRRKKAFRGASSKKIFTTKNGQPYIKLASGKARFISKKSATARRKRKGGFR